MPYGSGGGGASRGWPSGVKARGHFWYRDFHGRVRADTVDFGESVTEGAVENAATLLQACVDTHIGLVTMETELAPEDLVRGAVGLHATERHVLELDFADADGAITTIPVVGPKEVLINPDGTVDETQADAANLIAYLLEWGVSADGFLFATFQGGRLRPQLNGADSIVGVSENIGRGPFFGRFHHRHGWDVGGGE